MVKKKGEDEGPLLSWLDRHLDEVEKRNPIVATRYYVAEVTPSKRYPVYNGDGHGGATWEWTGVSQEIVSPYHDDKKDVEKFIKEHEPDEGKTLVIRTQHKRRTVTERWT